MNTGMVHIDGSQGEGGGQILRSSLALSMALGQPFTISNIRANRSKPGLMRQHVTAVEAAAAICGAEVTGASAGSGQLVFRPGEVRGGERRFSIGSAGSTALVLQAILPALMFADGSSEVVIEGGTHARWAPPFEFLRDALIPVINRLGPTVTVTLDRRGYYPAGGGRIRVRIEPGRAQSIQLEHRGETVERSATIALAKLPAHIGQRQLDRIQARLGWDAGPERMVWDDSALSPGNVVFLTIRSAFVTEVFSSIGEHGKLAETVADEAIEAAREYIASDAPVGRYLADQLMVPLAVSAVRGGGSSSFRTLPLSRHAQSNAEIIEAFLPGWSSTEPSSPVRWSVGSSA